MTITLWTYWLAKLGHRKSIGLCADSRAENQAVLDRARRAIRSGRLKLATALVEECGDAVEVCPACLNVLGLIAEANGDWQGARRCWSKALQLNPLYTPAYDNLRRWMELFNWGRSTIPVSFGDEPAALLALRKTRQS